MTIPAVARGGQFVPHSGKVTGMLAAAHKIVIPSIPEAPFAWALAGIALILVCAIVVWLIRRKKPN
jgi:hypothetical protein